MTEATTASPIPPHSRCSILVTSMFPLRHITYAQQLIFVEIAFDTEPSRIVILPYMAELRAKATSTWASRIVRVHQKTRVAGNDHLINVKPAPAIQRYRNDRIKGFSLLVDGYPAANHSALRCAPIGPSRGLIQHTA